MKKVLLLDCTLRDGGYINNWNFGQEAITGIHQGLVKSGVDIIELGFLRDEPYSLDRTIFSHERQLKPFLHTGPKRLYSVMTEINNPFPLEKLCPRSEMTVDIIRVIIWKELQREGLAYCRAIKAKGYDVCIQPVKVDQYSDLEFVNLVRLFNQMCPYSFCIVDSWGTQDWCSVQHYAKLANEFLLSGVGIGYHGHNNLQQVFGCAQQFAELSVDREIIIDGSVYGMGRGAGNLHIELFVQYMNIRHNRSYTWKPLLDVYDTYIEDIYKKSPWGYSPLTFLTGTFNCHPDWINHFKDNSVSTVYDAFASMDKKTRDSVPPKK